jgi:hypothetical protein
MGNSGKAAKCSAIEAGVFASPVGVNVTLLNNNGSNLVRSCDLHYSTEWSVTPTLCIKVNQSFPSLWLRNVYDPAR